MSSMGQSSTQQQTIHPSQTRGETLPQTVFRGTQNEAHRDPEYPVEYSLNGNQILMMLQGRDVNSIRSSNSGVALPQQLPQLTSPSPSDQSNTTSQPLLLHPTPTHILQTSTRQVQTSRQRENAQWSRSAPVERLEREQRAQSAPGGQQTQSSPQSTTYAPRTSVRPQFRSKIVCQLACKYCQVPVCRRGMKAILLADTNVELYSTDSPPA
ncbi:Protein fam72a, partial [Nowakowskiella sp. JEL0078]